VCNTYDALTRTCVWRPAYPPFEALRKMEARKETLDRTMFKRLIMILADADLMQEKTEPAKPPLATPPAPPAAAGEPQPVAPPGNGQG
jgi:HD-GYP domain-containing protein (c-di-GMP phosphodiesterase class II)